MLEKISHRMAFLALKALSPSKKNGSLFACIGIRENQSDTAEKLFIRHGQPRMISVAASSHLPCPVDDIRTKDVESDIRIYLIDKVGTLFTGIKLVNQICIIGNIHT